MPDFTKFFEGIKYLGPGLEDGDVVTDVIIVSRVMRADNGPKSALTIHVSEDIDPFVQVGMIETARTVIGTDFSEDDED
jgi:hypothetical protein